VLNFFMQNITISKFISLLYRVINMNIYFSSEYRSEDCVCIVLDKPEILGYRVLSMTGIGQTCI
jgi:hypothetical protein